MPSRFFVHGSWAALCFKNNISQNNFQKSSRPSLVSKPLLTLQQPNEFRRNIFIGRLYFSQPMRIILIDCLLLCCKHTCWMNKIWLPVFQKYCVIFLFWSILMLRDLGQKNVSAELFIMTFPISLGLLHHLRMPY